MKKLQIYLLKLIKDEFPKIAAVLNTNAENIEQLYDLVP